MLQSAHSPATANKPFRFLLTGAGFSGAVLGRRLAEAGHAVTVVEQRDHVAGNCHTERDPETRVMLHKYGPHIFHTDRDDVWDFVRLFGEFKPFELRVKSTTGGRVFGLPINLLTINQFFGKAFSPSEAESFISSRADKSIGNPQNFEEQALSMIGKELYEAFFKSYTIKQWGLDPSELPAGILKRLPVRFNYDDNYFNHPYQGIPVDGYTRIVERILDHPGMEVRLKTRFEDMNAGHYDHVFYSGQLDRYFSYGLGRLGYRTLDFENIVSEGDFQGTPLMNYPDEDIEWTRINEHKHYAYWENHEKTVCTREYSRNCKPDDVPYYPIRLAREKSLLGDYVELARKTKGVSFIGRLGTYRYLDMDRTIGEALDAASSVLRLLSCGDEIPPFFVNPIE